MKIYLTEIYLYVVIHHTIHWLVKTTSKKHFGERLDKIHEELTWLLDKYQPDAIAVESVNHGKNVTSSITTGGVLGVVALTAHVNDIEYSAFTPQQVKKVSGLGSKVSKDEMIRMSNLLLGCKLSSHHLADAAMVALAGCLFFRSPYTKEVK